MFKVIQVGTKFEIIDTRTGANVAYLSGATQWNNHASAHSYALRLQEKEKKANLS